MRSIFSCLPTIWQVTQCGACRYRLKEEGKCVAFFSCLPTIWQVTRCGTCRY